MGNKIIVASRTKAGRVLMSNSLGPTITHIVSIGTWDHDQRPPAGYFKHAAKKIRLKFHDVTWDRDNLISPKIEDVKRLIDFYNIDLFDKNDKNYLIHCWAGQSRSTAAAMILLTLSLKDEDAAATELFTKVAPWAGLNIKMIEHADTILNGEGKIKKAIDKAKDLTIKNNEAIR